jgi:hypothetical protein
MHIKTQYNEDEIYNMLENYEITKLDINRIYRYLDKYTQKTLEVTNDDDKVIDSDDDTI